VSGEHRRVSALSQPKLHAASRQPENSMIDPPNPGGELPAVLELASIAHHKSCAEARA
jgi:hypothetical protein